MISCYGWEEELVMKRRECALKASGRSVKTSNIKFSINNKELHHQDPGDNFPNTTFAGNLKNVLEDEEIWPPAL